MVHVDRTLVIPFSNQGSSKLHTALHPGIDWTPGTTAPPAASELYVRVKRPLSGQMLFASVSTMLFSGAGKALQNIYIFTWDAWLTVVNLFRPNLKIGTVVPQGSPGAGGKWPEFVPPKEGDSRSCCPALNALANHGAIRFQHSHFL